MKPGSIIRHLQMRELGLQCRVGSGGIPRAATCLQQDVAQVIAEEKSTLPSNNQACELSGDSRSTFLMTFSSDGTKVASTHGDHSVRVTDLLTGKCHHVLKGHPRTPWSIAFHPSSNDILASGCLGGQVRIWDLCGGGSEVWSSSRGLIIASLAFHPTDQVLVFAASNEIFFWDWSQPEPFASCKTAHDYEKVRMVKFDPLGQYLYTGIANASTVHSQQDHIGYINTGDEAIPAEEHHSLQRHYQSLVQQIGSRQRDRLGAASGVWDSHHLGARAAARSAVGSQWVSERQADLEVITPRSPSYEQEAGLEEARAYAAAITRQANQHSASVASTTADATPRSTTDREPDSSIASLWNEQLVADRWARERERERNDANRQITLSHSQTVVMDNQVSASGETPGTNTVALAAHSPLSVTVSNTSVVCRAATGTSNTSVLSFAVGQEPVVSSRSSGAATDTTTTSTSQNPATSGELQVPSVPASVRRLSHRRMNQLSAPRSHLSLAHSSRSSRFSPFQRGHHASRHSEPNTVQPVTVVSAASSMSFELTSSSGTGISSSNGDSVLRSHLVSRLPPASTGLLNLSSVSSTRPVMSSSISSRSSSTSSTTRTHTSVTDSFAPSTTPSLPTIPVMPTRFSRSTSSRETGHSVVQRLRQAEQPQRLACIIESEVRQALDQVRSQRLNISETLHDLDSLQQDLETVTSQSGINLNGESEESSTPSASAPNVSAPSASAPSASTLGASAPSVSAPSASATSVSAPSGSSVADVMPDNAGTTVTTDSATPTTVTALMSDTVTVLGAISTQLDQRIQQLDNRVSEIQQRLRERVPGLNRTDSLELSGSGVRVTSAETWQSRRQRLRGYLDYLRSRYGFSSSQQVTADSRREESMVLGSTREEEAPESVAHHQRSEAVSRVATSSSRSTRLRQLHEEIHSIRQEMTARHQQAERRLARRYGAGIHDPAWFSLERRNSLHAHYSVSILDDTINSQSDGLQSAINRAIAGAFMARGESNVASNIVNLTNRIQRWDFTKCDIPDISDSSANIVVPHCKLHNDATCDFSQDGQLLAVFVPSHRGFPDDAILAVYSLRPGPSFKQCLYTKSFGPNAITVSLSPLNNYVLVGLASKRIAWVFTTRQMVAQVYQLSSPGAGEDSMQHICDLMHPCDLDIRTYVSVNSARWLPASGQGIIYGTNRGDLHICRPGHEEREKANSDLNEDSNSIRRNLMHFLGRSVPRTISAATQTVHRVRRTASTQTEGLPELEDESGM